VLTEGADLVGTDGQGKMGKSRGNAIYLSDDAQTVTLKVMGMSPIPSGSAPTFPAVWKAIQSSSTTTPLTPTWTSERAEGALSPGKVGDVEVKRKLARALERVPGAAS